MTRVQILSDTHCEMHRDRGQSFIESLDPTGVDVLVLAGDICSARFYENLIDFYRPLCAKYPHVVLVLGNHEFYLTSPRQVEHNFLRLFDEIENLYRLENNYILLNGQRFVGSTLWFPDIVQSRVYRRNINDFNLIKDFVPWVFEKNAEAQAFLRKTVEPSDIVITHHLPSPKSIHPQYAGSGLNDFFITDMTDLIERVQPKLFLHGHTHSQMDYAIGSTRVVANPMGYPNEGYALNAFNDRFVIDV